MVATRSTATAVSTSTGWLPHWQRRGLTTQLLRPFSLLFSAIATLRQSAYQAGLLASWGAPVPLVIVGNLTVGGTGKSPVVMALAQALQARGWRPGIVSRGYGAQLKAPILVNNRHSSSEVGDEPLMLYRALEPFNIPLAIYPKRRAAIELLLAQRPDCNVIICDDGLQHYALQRQPGYTGGHDVELIVFDARIAGNGLRLPAGPLREPLSRPVDAVIWNLPEAASTVPVLKDNPAPAYTVHLALQSAYQLINPQQQATLSVLATQQAQGKVILAAAGIGHPERFFQALCRAGFQQASLQTLPLPDHFAFSHSPFPVIDAPNAPEIILITEKDAVKCQHLQDERLWVVPARISLPVPLLTQIETQLNRPQLRK